MTRRHTATLALLALATLISAAVTGELMDMLTVPNARLIGLGIVAGTFATCGFIFQLEKLLEEGTL